MFSPYEELEYLADYLPDEGESVVVTRRGGELVCEPHQPIGRIDALADPEFYGRLVHANERLTSLGSRPMWTTAIGLFWGCVFVHLGLGLGWQYWFVDVGLTLAAAVGCFRWIRRRQRQYYREKIQPSLEGEMVWRSIDRYVLMGALRQRGELRAMLDEIVASTGD